MIQMLLSKVDHLLNQAATSKSRVIMVLEQVNSYRNLDIPCLSWVDKSLGNWEKLHTVLKILFFTLGIIIIINIHNEKIIMIIGLFAIF